MASSQGATSQRQSALTWQDLDESCHRLDEAHIRIESLDLSCMEEEGASGPDPTSSSEDEDEGSFLTAEAAVALLARVPSQPPSHQPVVGFQAEPVLRQAQSPGPDQRVNPVSLGHSLGRSQVQASSINWTPNVLQASESWGSAVSWASTFQSESSAGSALQSELSIGSSDTEIMSPFQLLRLAAASNEPARAASEKLHRLAVSNHAQWEEGSSSSGTPSQCGTPVSSHVGTQPPGGCGSKDVWRIEEGYSSRSEKLHRLAVSNSSEVRGRGRKGPKRTSSEVSRRKGEVVQMSMERERGEKGERRLSKGSSFPQSQDERCKEERLVIPSIMAEIDPTWDLWEGRGDFSGSGEKESSLGWEAGPAKISRGGGMKRMFGLFSRYKT